MAKPKGPQKSPDEVRRERYLAKSNYQTSKDQFKANQRELDKQGLGRYEQKDSLRLERERYKQDKSAYRAAKKADYTTLTNRAKRFAGRQAKFAAKNGAIKQAKKAVRGEDSLAAGLDAYEKQRQYRRYRRGAKTVGKFAFRSGKNVAKGSYHLGNRFFNLQRGYGFKKTPYEKQLWGGRAKLNKARQRTRRKMQKRIRLFADNHKNVSLVGRLFGKGTKNAFKVFSPKTGWIIGFLIIVIALSSSFFSPAGLKQDNHEINDTWLELTKRDADNTDDTHYYFTNWQPFMFYLNEMFGDYKPNDTNNGGGYTKLRDQFKSMGKDKAIDTYPAVLTNLWSQVNQDDSPLTVKQLMGGENIKKDASSWDKVLNPWSATVDTKEGTETSEMIGFSALDNQLDKIQDSDQVTITRRYGYEKVNGQSVVHTGNTIEATQGAAVFAPRDGTIEVLNDHAVKIYDNNNFALTIDGLSNIQVSNGQVVQTGQNLGLASGTSLELTYSLYDDLEKQWFNANVGFYFPKVQFTQVTTIADDNFDPSKNREERAKKIYQYLVKKGYKRAGIAAFLGNWDIESSITAKRAEGDYLKPPVGASDSSWDDENWLNMGNNEIYGGRFPNIVHRGLGLGQWTDTSPSGGRSTMLREYAKSKNKKWYDLLTQIDFMIEADSQKELAKQILSSDSTDVPSLTSQVLIGWEGNRGNKVAERTTSALNWYTWLEKQKLTDDDKKSADTKENNDYWDDDVLAYYHDDPNGQEQFKKMKDTDEGKRLQAAMDKKYGGS